MKKSHVDEGEGMCRRYFARWSQVHLGRGVRKRQESTAVSNLSVQKVHNTNPYSSKNVSVWKRKRQKKSVEKTAKNMVNVAAYFETSFKHVTITHDNSTWGKHEYTSTRSHTEIRRHHTSYCIFYCKALNVSSNNSIIL